MNSEKIQDQNSLLLDPSSRASEILFGLIMVLSFTCSISAANAGETDIKELLIAALGCNLAWGIIDAFFYLMNITAERGRERLLASKIKQYPSTCLSNLLPYNLASKLSKSSLDEIKKILSSDNDISQGALIKLRDFRVAFLIFALVFLATFPVAIPFLLFIDPLQALRISNAIAIVLLFSLGYGLGQYAGRKAWLWGLSMTLIGSALVSMTIALGG